MSARDEAIEAMVDQEPADMMDDDVVGCGQLLDAIPADVLARLAIERGGLTRVEIGIDVSEGLFAYDPTARMDIPHPEEETLYRPVEPRSTQSPDHELQPAEPALDILENGGRAPMSLRERLGRFLVRDPHEPYTGANE